MDPCTIDGFGSSSYGYDDGGNATINYPPFLSTYAYLLVFQGDRGQLCREFGDEFADERGCPRRDVRCATAGEVVLTANGVSVSATFSGGERVEAAWPFRRASDAGRADGGL